MRTLEIRRHTHRNVPRPHLSQQGIDLARRAGEGLGHFDRVITSTVPRAFETAIAMGYAVDEQIEALSTMGDDVDAEIQWNAGFAEWARVVKRGGAAARFAQEQAALWRLIARALPQGGRALLITHGGIIEAGAAGCLPADARPADDAACGYCEGVRVTLDGGTVVNAEMLRVDQPR